MSRRPPGGERPTRPGRPAKPDTLRFLNQPRRIHVQTSPRSAYSVPIPIALLQEGRTRTVECLEDTWLLEDEWWRQRICRRYYRLALVDGPRITVFHDCAEDAWYAQGY